MTTTRDRGRKGARVKTPLLIRSYLMGESFATPEDPDREATQRRVQGDYISRMHRRLKRRMQELQKGYHYPRLHSFQALVNNLIKLKLIEPTAHVEPSIRAQFPNFKERRFFRLVPGAEARAEWADPIFYIAQIYPNIRKHGGLPPTGARALEEKVSGSTRRAGRPPAATPQVPADQAQQLADLRLIQDRVKELSTKALTANQPQQFAQLLREANHFLDLVSKIYPLSPFPEAGEAITLLESCVRNLSGERGLNQQRATYVRSCQNAARLLFESVERPLQAPRPRPGLRKK